MKDAPARLATSAAVNSRHSQRTNVFLSAVLQLPASSLPVRIRNLSPLGALVDGEVLPEQDQSILLKRGSLSAHGIIVWRKTSHCGIRFASLVPVQEWITHGAGHKGQQRVDEIMSLLKDRTGFLSDPAEPPARPPRGQLVDGEELRALSETLEFVAARFSTVPALPDRFAGNLQELDFVRQRLMDLSQVLRADAS